MTECRGSIVAIIKLHAPSSSTSHFPSCVCVVCPFVWVCVRSMCACTAYFQGGYTCRGALCVALSVCVHARTVTRMILTFTLSIAIMHIHSVLNKRGSDRVFVMATPEEDADNTVQGNKGVCKR